jgi:alkylhydroperoxidase/carboxymuconolactone decarboxylase family protein
LTHTVHPYNHAPARQRSIQKQEVIMSSYYNPADLAAFGTVSDAAPELGEKFFSYYGAVFEDGALTAREKSLIALAVAHAVQCPYCIDAYTNDTLKKGCDAAEITEAIHVACAIRGGASLVHGVQAKNIFGDVGF